MGSLGYEVFPKCLYADRYELWRLVTEAMGVTVVLDLTLCVTVLSNCMGDHGRPGSVRLETNTSSLKTEASASETRPLAMPRANGNSKSNLELEQTDSVGSDLT